jgi:hypothetical protein
MIYVLSDDRATQHAPNFEGLRQSRTHVPFSSRIQHWMFDVGCLMFVLCERLNIEHGIFNRDAMLQGLWQDPEPAGRVLALRIGGTATVDPIIAPRPRDAVELAPPHVIPRPPRVSHHRHVPRIVLIERAV